MMKMVKIRPEGESSLTSLKPTVKIVITVPQDPDKNHHHQENSRSPHPESILQ